MFANSRARFATLVIVCSVAATSIGCGSTEPDDEPDVQTIRLVIGTSPNTQTVDIDRADATADITIATGTHDVIATFLRANGAIEPLVNTTEFELRLEGMNTSIATFTRTGAFTGTLTGVAAGSTAVTVQLFHLEEGHPDFEKAGTLTVTG